MNIFKDIDERIKEIEYISKTNIGVEIKRICDTKGIEFNNNGSYSFRTTKLLIADNLWSSDHVDNINNIFEDEETLEFIDKVIKLPLVFQILPYYYNEKDGLVY